MSRIALILLVVGTTASPAVAQERGRSSQGVPPGHLPPPDMCRVWYDGVPPGQQPPPTSCYEAERRARGTRGVRVIYGERTVRHAPVYRGDREYPGEIWRDDDRRLPRGEGRRPNRDGDRTGRAVPRREEYPGRYEYPDARYPQQRGEYGYRSEAYRRGYEDGLVKGREDTRDRDSFDPARHSWYRNADRGYNRRHGAREDYRSDYRRGFLAGYEDEHYRR